VALRRALHFVFKVGDRSKTATFYRDVLGMKIFRMGFTDRHSIRSWDSLRADSIILST
uniref:Glyoxalase/fosfomycin resistance/dioxygenase domain-containing protein n=1 Tax=Salmo trutta TaxID=8032 RepID=A0A673ZP16_SALTR